MKRVLILNGVARCGKDTFADAIGKRSSENNFLYASMSTVDVVKAMLEIAGIDKNKKSDKDRKLMSDLKDLLTEHSDIPFNKIRKRISTISQTGRDCVFTVMCREPEEIQKFKDFYGDECVAIIITRPDLETPNNHADQNVAKFDYDIEVSNSGTEANLESIAQHVCDTIFED